MKFGILKSKIEKMLLESYKTNTFKNEIKNFNELVLKNRNMSKLFYLYDELNSNKNLSESVANEYIFESIIHVKGHNHKTFSFFKENSNE